MKPREDELLRFLAGDMSPAQRDAFAQRLEQPGMADLRGLAELAGALRRIPAREPTRDLVPGVMQAIAAEDAPRRALPRLLPFSLPMRLAAGFLVLFGVAALILRLIGSPGGASPRVAVVDGAEWLIRAQDTSGAWSAEHWGGKPEFETGITGLALMALGRSGEAANCEGGPEAIDRAVAYLRNAQNEDGSFGPRCDAQLYNHGIATVALLEAHRRAPRAALAPVLERALAFVCDNQTTDGGWRYAAGDSRPNTAISVWQIQALSLAAANGWSEADIPLRRGLRWLSLMIGRNGDFGYTAPDDTTGSSPGVTAMGAALMLETGNAAMLAAARRDSLRDAVARGMSGHHPADDFYTSFFTAAALRSEADPRFGDLLSELREDLARGRVSRGENVGSWNPEDRWGSAGGRAYATAMAMMSLH